MPEIYVDIEGKIGNCAYCPKIEVSIFPVGEDGKYICIDCMNNPDNNKYIQEQMNLLTGFKMPAEKNN